MKKISKNQIVMLITILVVGVLAFFGGIQYQKSQSPLMRGAFLGQSQNQNQNQKRTGNQNGFVPLNGSINSIDGDSITVKFQDGSSKIAILSQGSTINKTSTGSKADLKVGDSVMVVGTTNTDGTVAIKVLSIGSGPSMQPVN